jgi:phage major head subunit gpT-like protein
MKMKKLEFLSDGKCVIEAAAPDGDEQKQPTFSMQAYNGGPMSVGFKFPVTIDLAGLRSATQVVILRDHDRSKIVGRADSVTINGDGVAVTGTITGRSGAAGEVLEHAAGGFQWPVSVGVHGLKMEKIAKGKSANVNGRLVDGPALIAREGTLREISFVGIGADEEAKAEIAASAARNNEGENGMTFSKWLAENGHDKDSISDEELDSLAAEYHEETQGDNGEDEKPVNADADEGDAVQAQRERMAAEMKRVADIEAKCGENKTLAAKAVAEGWTVEKAELEILRAERPKAPAGYVEDNSISGDVLEAAICQSAGVGDLEKDFDEKTLDAAHKRYRGRLGLQELLLEAALANGYDGRSVKQDLRGVLQAAFSTSDISGILGNTANKALLDGYNYVEQAWRQVASTSTVTDFKQRTSYRMYLDGRFQKVGPDGELQHTESAEESYTNQADTYGRMFSITRKDIINDDLDALSALPRQIGRQAGLALNHVFWTEFLADADTFYTTARGNLVEGTDYALTAADVIAAIVKAWQTFLDQTDADGEPLGAEPRILLTGTSLGAYARELYESTTVDMAGTTAKRKPTNNVYQGMFTPVVSRYIGNSNYTGSSTSAWWLMADPRDIPVIDVAFLNGQQVPTIEQSDADFNTLGIQMRGYFDFGVNKQDYRGAVKMTGVASS